MKRIVFCFLLFAGSINYTYSQVKSILLDGRDRIVADSALAVNYAVFGKVEGDTVYTFKKFDFNGVLLTSGTFKDDSLQVPHGNFVYYDWITPDNNYTNLGYEINGKARFVVLSGKYINGLRVGRWLSFYADGKVKQLANYVQGALNGLYQSYDNSGKVQISGSYIRDKKQGTWTLRGGKQEDEYVDDKLISSLTGKKLRDKQAQRKNVN
jgi:antitoxin component YwqK of YwqJK toxin-antitoxin module